MYILRFFSNTESFYKVGITKQLLKERFTGIPYQYEVLEHVGLKLYDAVMLEDSLKNEFHKYRYKPLNYFTGHTECFSELDLEKINEIINDYKKE